MEGVAKHANAGAPCSVDFSVQEAGGCPLKAARRKILKPRGFVHWAHAGALRVNVIVVEAVIVVQEASACALKVAHRNAACVVQAGVHISCVFTRFLSFMICSSRTGHPTEVFRSTRGCSSRTCAQATSASLENRVHAPFSTSVFVVARVLSCTLGRALAYFHIPTHLCSYTFTIQVRLSEERAKDDVDVGPDADTKEMVEIEIQEEVVVGCGGR